MNARLMGRLPAVLILLALSACTLPLSSATPATLSPTPPDIPTRPATATPSPSAAPDLTATALQRTLDAMAATSMAAQATLAALQRTGTPLPTPTATSRPAGRTPASPAPTRTPAPSPTPAPTTTTTPAYTLIEYFTATPQTINPGDSITLAWSAQGDSATLYTVQPGGPLGQFWDVPLTGSRVMPTSSSVRNQVSFMLAVQRGDQTEMASVSVTVNCPDTWFFTNPPGECPQSSALISLGVAQRFEGGLMIWIQSSGAIYILYSGGGSPAWDYTPDPWQPGLPESDPAIVPPEGLYQPVRGFGMIWRGEGSALNVRSRLGWALAPEFSFNTAYQCNSAPRYVTCYLLGPDGVIVLKPERSGWYLWTGPTPSP
jgi:hypothetical protein